MAKTRFKVMIKLNGKWIKAGFKTYSTPMAAHHALRGMKLSDQEDYAYKIEKTKEN